MRRGLTVCPFLDQAWDMERQMMEERISKAYAVLVEEAYPESLPMTYEEYRDAILRARWY